MVSRLICLDRPSRTPVTASSSARRTQAPVSAASTLSKVQNRSVPREFVLAAVRGRVLRKGRRGLRAAVEVFGTEHQGADQALDVLVVRFFRIPQSLVEAALVLVVAHLTAEVEDEVGLDDRTDETLLIDGLLRKRGQTLALEGIAHDDAVVRVVDQAPLCVLVSILAVVAIAQPLIGQRRQDLM